MAGDSGRGSRSRNDMSMQSDDVTHTCRCGIARDKTTLTSREANGLSKQSTCAEVDSQQTIYYIPYLAVDGRSSQSPQGWYPCISDRWKILMKWKIVMVWIFTLRTSGPPQCLSAEKLDKCGLTVCINPTYCTLYIVTDFCASSFAENIISRSDHGPVPRHQFSGALLRQSSLHP